MTELILTIGLMFFSSMATLAATWLRRDKIEAEADVDASQAEKIKSDAVVTLYQTIAKMSMDIQSQASETLEYIKRLGSFQRDVWRLQGENQRRAEREGELVAQIKHVDKQVEDLMQSKTALEVQVRELTQSNEQLEERISELTQASTDKDDQIEQMRGRIQTLEIEREDLNRRLDDATGDNGKIITKEVPVVVESTETPPEMIVDQAEIDK
jgi:chromosome segregation ATPase